MSKVIDETGKRYGRLVVLRDAGRNLRQNVLWECQCDCGNKCVVEGGLLRSGNTKSCGCLRVDWPKEHLVTHGMNRKGRPHPLYRVWTGMKTRCTNSNESSYKNYGGRGIAVCDEWQEFEPFMEWALTNGYKHGLEIDREDNDGDYTPENCRFVTSAMNARNKRNNHHVTINGKTMLITDWAKVTGISRFVLHYRLSAGWAEKDLLAPVGRFHNMANPRTSAG